MSILLFFASILSVVLIATTTATACSGSLSVEPVAELTVYAPANNGALLNASSAFTSNPDGSGTYTCPCTTGPFCTIVFGNDDTVSTTIPGSAISGIDPNAPAGTGSVVLSSVSIVCNQATGQLTTPDGTLVTRVACFDFF